MVGIKRSRIQFRVHKKAGRSNKKAQNEQRNQRKVPLNGPKFMSDEQTSVRVAAVHRRHVGKEETMGNEILLGDTLYHEVLQETGTELVLFSKQRVQSIKEIADSGQFQSLLHPKVAFMAETHPAASECAIEDDSDNWPDSPPESLVETASIRAEVDDELQLQHQSPEAEPSAPSSEPCFSLPVPIYQLVNGRLEMQRREESALGSPKQPPVKKAVDKPQPQLQRAPELSTRSPVAQHGNSLLKTICTLFAGRKRAKPAAPPTPSSSPPPNSHDCISWSHPADSPMPSTSSAPRLTHAQTIPDPRRRRPVQPSTRRDFLWDVEPAPHHRFTGYSVVAPNRSAPKKVTKGFDVPTPGKTGEKKHDNRGIMDREGDVWAKWYKMEEEEVRKGI